MPTKQVRVAIIGGGISGMVLAIELKKIGLSSYTIYERMTDVGGTWRDNYYPGCACDVPVHWYSLSTELNPDWPTKFSGQPEIQKYWKRIYEKHQLASNTQLDSTFLSAVWNDASGYTCKFKSTASGKEFTVVCDVLVSAIGGFSTPKEKPPGMEGLELFGGKSFHSARWNKDVELSGKRVAVIGNGCSGAQFIPIISEDPTTDVINFCRTPNWFAPRPQKSYSSVTKAAFRYVPGLMRTYRNFIALSGDARFAAWQLKNAGLRTMAEEHLWSYMSSQAPEKYHDFLRPSYPMGCKRIIMDPGYLKALHRPNLDLVTKPITSITKKGIMADGVEREFDVIILATGFSFEGEKLGLDIKGRHGKRLADQWEAQGGPQAYLGTSVHGFPNFYTLLGPNAAGGAASALYSIEAQVGLVVQMIKPMMNYGVKSFETKIEAEKGYNLDLQVKLHKTVWHGGCSSWYLNGDKLVANFPGFVTELVLMLRTPTWDSYIQRGGTRRLAVRHRLHQLLQIVGLVAFGVVVCAIGRAKIQREIASFTLARFHELKEMARTQGFLA
ncbi:hypothetical protein RQP46_009245 [Phenoliferia psychrophenolica]